MTCRTIAKRLGVGHAIIALTSSGYDRRQSYRTQPDRRRPGRLHRDRRRALEMCTAAGVKALTVPSYDDLISGKVTVSQIRNVEPEDLLGRDPVVLDNEGLHGLLTGKTVLVTGAGGSIGSELCRQIARFAPGRLVLLELNEFALYNVEQEFQASFPDIPMVFRHRRYQGQAPLGPGFFTLVARQSYSTPPLTSMYRSWNRITPGRQC